MTTVYYCCKTRTRADLSDSSPTERCAAKHAIAHMRIWMPWYSCLPRMSQTPWFGITWALVCTATAMHQQYIWQFQRASATEFFLYFIVNYWHMLYSNNKLKILMYLKWQKKNSEQGNKTRNENYLSGHSRPIQMCYTNDMWYLKSANDWCNRKWWTFLDLQTRCPSIHENVVKYFSLNTEVYRVWSRTETASQTTYPPTILQFGDRQNSTLYIDHVTSNSNAECLQVWVIVELGLRNLSHIHTGCGSQHRQVKNLISITPSLLALVC